MKTQNWPIPDLQQLDIEARKIMVENGRNQTLGSKALLYLPRKVGGRGLKAVANEYKLTMIKTAVILCQNQYHMILSINFKIYHRENFMKGFQRFFFLTLEGIREGGGGQSDPPSIFLFLIFVP